MHCAGSDSLRRGCCSSVPPDPCSPVHAPCSRFRMYSQKAQTHTEQKYMHHICIQCINTSIDILSCIYICTYIHICVTGPTDHKHSRVLTQTQAAPAASSFPPLSSHPGWGSTSEHINTYVQGASLQQLVWPVDAPGSCVPSC